jgi:XTP/dITP diphosphohydrolase
VLTQAQLGISEAEEPHVTFIENALAKARHVSRLSGQPSLADDSGICVAALGGAPGVFSARYAGEPKSDQRNNEKLLHDMQGVVDRRAHYYCVLVMVRGADDPQPIIAEGEWHGEIALEQRGDGGFGYDPLFWLPELGKMSAELTREEKHEISHRGKAMRVLLQRLSAE